MIVKRFLNGLVILLIICLQTIFSYKYDMELKNEDIFTPCDIEGVHFVDEYFDFSHITFEFLPNGSVYALGYITLIKEIGLTTYPTAVQIFKKNRDTWVNTIYNLKRDDMCKTVFNPAEPIYDFSKDIQGDARTCPMRKGVVFHYNSTSDLELPDVPDPRLDGEYKVRITINFPDINEVLCAEIMADLFRI